MMVTNGTDDGAPLHMTTGGEAHITERKQGAGNTRQAAHQRLPGTGGRKEHSHSKTAAAMKGHERENGVAPAESLKESGRNRPRCSGEAAGTPWPKPSVGCSLGR